jgi:C4-dicarboxylate-binding protein DctP
LTPEQLTAWQDAMRPVWDEFRDRIGADLVNAALAAAQ